MDHSSPATPAEGSGTSRLPAAEGAMHGLHFTPGDWMVMYHGYAWGTYSDQGGPRGDSQAFVTSMGDGAEANSPICRPARSSGCRPC